MVKLFGESAQSSAVISNRSLNSLGGVPQLLAEPRFSSSQVEISLPGRYIRGFRQVVGGTSYFGGVGGTVYLPFSASEMLTTLVRVTPVLERMRMGNSPRRRTRAFQSTMVW